MKGAVSLKSINTVEKQNLIKLGSYIRKARTNKNISLRELSLLICINHKTIYFIESARIRRIDPNMLVKISSILKLDLVKMLILAGYSELVFRLKFRNNDE